MNKSKLVALYIESEKRALPCALGKAFLADDRLAIVNAMRDLKVTKAELAKMVHQNLIHAKVEDTTYAVHYGRLNIFERQVTMGHIVLGKPATGEHMGVETPVFDGRIKTRDDVQPAFNRAAKALIRIGITSPADAEAYLVKGFEFVKQEQKIDLKADRIVQELQLGDLTREQVLATLDRVKAKF